MTDSSGRLWMPLLGEEWAEQEAAGIRFGGQVSEKIAVQVLVTDECESTDDLVVVLGKIIEGETVVRVIVTLCTVEGKRDGSEMSLIQVNFFPPHSDADE